MVRAFITGIEVAHPPQRLDQMEAAAHIGAASGEKRAVAALARGTKIATRRLVLSPVEIASLGSIEARNAIYARVAPDLAVEAARKTLAVGRAPDFLVTSSCTGYLVPGLDVQVAERLGLPCEAARLPITESGCAGGVVALARAFDYVRAQEDSSALVVATEVCSLAFHPKGDEGNLISTLLFGDGAGAAIVASGSAAGEEIEIVDYASMLVPGTKEAIGFDLTDEGFRPRLSRELADILPDAAKQVASRLLGRNCLEARDIAAWLLHPGGPRILERLEDGLGFGRQASRWSWQSLTERGNTSSAAIFDVLSRYRRDFMAPKGWVVAMAFGPGVSIEALLLRRW